MATKLFDSLNSDRHYDGDVTISSEDVVESTIEAVEAEVLYAEATEEINLYKTALEQRDNLEGIIETHKAILDNGKADTASAAMAKAGLESICVTLGFPTEYYDISTESINDTPSYALRASLESSKSVLTTVLEAIKKFVDKIKMFVSKATLKLVVAVSRVEKSAEAFSKTISGDSKEGKLNEGVTSYPEKVAKGIKTKFGTVLIDNKLDDNLFKNIGKDIKAVKGNLESLSKVSKDDLTERSTKALLAVSSPISLTKVLKNMNKYFPNYPNVDTGTGVITRYDGSMLRAAIFYEKKGEDGKTTAYQSTYFEGTVKKDIINKLEVKDILPYNKLADLADVSKEIAKGLKDLTEAGGKALDNVKKIVGDAKTELEKSIKDATEKAEKDDATAEDKSKAKALKEEVRVKTSAIDSFAHVVPKAVLDTAWMSYRFSVSTLWVAQQTYKLYK